MTTIEQQGYDAQRSGVLDPELSLEDTAAGRQYREGARRARRDLQDAQLSPSIGLGIALSMDDRAVEFVVDPVEKVFPADPTNVLRVTETIVRPGDWPETPVPIPAQISAPFIEPEPAAPSAGGKPPYRVPLMADLPQVPWNGYKAASTFSGCGGSSLGYKLAGFRVAWANEFIPAAQDTYVLNHPGTILDRRDIRQVKPEEILAACGVAKGELDLFDGSPPCSSFSTAGIREEGWGREKKYSDTTQRTDDLFFEFVRILDGLQPKTFVAENVVGLTIGTAKEMLGEGQLDMFETQEDTILHKLMNCGYRVGFHVVNGAEQGVPQSRRRVIFVGIRKDLADRYSLEPKWPQALPYSYTVRDALPWIDKGPAANPYPIEPESDIARYAVGKEWDNLKPGQQSEKYFSEVKVHPDEPCPTICASHGSGSIASIVHPYEKRKFSIAELRRLGGFPDDFQLTGDYLQQWERIGRAVPPIMMAAIAATVRDEILGRMK